MGCSSSHGPAADTPAVDHSDLEKFEAATDAKGGGQDTANTIKTSPVFSIPQKLSKQAGGDGSGMVDVFVRCEDLYPAKNRPIPSFAVAYTRLLHEEAWSDLGKTEIVSETSWPNYSKGFKISFCAEVVRYVRFEVYRLRDSEEFHDLSRQTFIGGAEARLIDAITAKSAGLEGTGSDSGWLVKDLQNPMKAAPMGRIALWADEDTSAKNRVAFEICAKKLRLTDFWKFTTDPYFVVHRTQQLEEDEEIRREGSKQRGGRRGQMHMQGSVMEDTGPKLEQIVVRSEVVRRHRSPSWKRVEDLSAHDLCKGDASQVIVIEIWDWFLTGPPRLIGTASTNYEDMHKSFWKNQDLTLELFQKKYKKISGLVVPEMVPTGQIVMNKVGVDRSYTFLDFIRGGLALCPIIAVDMTVGNLEPQHRHSLHRLGGDSLNDYAASIKAIVEVLEGYHGSGPNAHYQAPKASVGYPVYGFGAKIPPAKGRCSQCFSLTGDFLMPLAVGVPGVLEAYHNSLRVVALNGPTQLDEIIRVAAQWARAHVQVQADDIHDTTDQKYFVLVILTNGNVTKQQAAADAISEAVDLPLSIVIVGIGDEDFDVLECLNEEAKVCQQMVIKVSCRMGHDCDLAAHSPADLTNLSNVCDECGCKVSTSPTHWDCRTCGLSLCENCSVWIAQKMANGPVYRDMVTFARCNDFRGRPSDLAAAALARVPDQLAEYHRMCDMKPRKLAQLETNQGLPMPRPKVDAAAGAKRKADAEKISRAEQLGLLTLGADRTASKLSDAGGASEGGGGAPPRAGPKALERELAAQVPDFLRERADKIVKVGKMLGYSGSLVERVVLKDGIAEESVEALVENLVHVKPDNPCYKDAMRRVAPKKKEVRRTQSKASRFARLTMANPEDGIEDAQSTLGRSTRLDSKSLRSVATSKQSSLGRSLRSAATSKELTAFDSPRSTTIVTAFGSPRSATAVTAFESPRSAASGFDGSPKSPSLPRCTTAVTAFGSPRSDASGLGGSPRSATNGFASRPKTATSVSFAEDPGSATNGFELPGAVEKRVFVVAGG